MFYVADQKVRSFSYSFGDKRNSLTTVVEKPHNFLGKHDVFGEDLPE